MDATDSLVATARAAVAEQSAKILSASLQQVANETSAALATLIDKWDAESAKNVREFELYQRRLKYGEAVASLTLLASSTDSAEASMTKFQLLLPSKQLSSSKAGSSSNRRIMSIVAQTSATSDLGPAVDNKVYEIPTRSFSFRYQELTSGTCELKLSNPYQSCDARLLSSYCVRITGDVDTDNETPLTSLFSTFRIQTSLSLVIATSAIKTLSFAGVEVSASLAVAVDLQLYHVKSKKSSKTSVPIEEDSDAGSDDGSASADGSISAAGERHFRPLLCGGQLLNRLDEWIVRRIPRGPCLAAQQALLRPDVVILCVLKWQFRILPHVDCVSPNGHAQLLK